MDGIHLRLGNYDYEVFMNASDFARKFVDRTISDALCLALKTKDYPMTFLGKEIPRDGAKREKNISWPTCGKVNSRNALRCIETMMDQWKALPVCHACRMQRKTNEMRDWMYHVEFIRLGSNDFSEFYAYRAKWSAPTLACPIPRVTASVFFNVEASRLKPQSYPVDVTYVFEGNRLIHRTNWPFQPKWLYDILDAKTIVFSDVDQP